ncbi:MAG: hypothetical protein ACJ79L_04475 [Anaeromyxobacteraceae bacterium]
MDCIDTGAFEGWVREWRIGPGMNDAQGARPFYERELAARDRDERWKEKCHRALALLDEGLYSGFDGAVGEGWVPILHRLARDLVDLGWDRLVRQVKEKFGRLVVYVPERRPEFHERIERATEESLRTCENCGAAGRTREGAAVVTLCAACATELNGG